ncbi:MAG: glycine cleavage system aminomethyltransferase GcvT [Salibacteraceae bacterium]
MKKTALYEKHLALQAKMVPFAGYEMPVQYTGINDEHLAVRNRVGVFDVSHMGEFFVKGPGSLDLLQLVTTNDVSKLTPGKVQYSCMTNEKGGIVDDLLVYCLADEEYMIVVNASNIEKDWNWISQHNSFGAKLMNRSDEISLLAIQGPKATDALQPLTGIDLSAMPYYTVQIGSVAGIDNAIVATTGYTGSGGYEVYVANKDAQRLWDAVFEAGASCGIAPAGLGARDTLRLEMGFCLYGNDIDDTTSPIEAGLGWITKFTKQFIAADILKQQKDNGPARKLVGFDNIEKGPIPRQGYDVLNEAGEIIGTITSGTMSPSLARPIAMGYVASPYSEPGTPVRIAIRNKTLSANVVKPPFYKKQ